MRTSIHSYREACGTTWGLIPKESFQHLLQEVGLGEKDAAAKTDSTFVPGGEAVTAVGFQSFCQAYVQRRGVRSVMEIQFQYEKMDTDFDGKISRQELTKHFSNEYPHMDAETRVAELFSGMDVKKNGFVYLEDLKRWYTEQPNSGNKASSDAKQSGDAKSAAAEGGRKMEDPRAWDVDQMCGWLRRSKKIFDLSAQTVQRLEEEECDGETLYDLSEPMLRQMGLRAQQIKKVMDVIVHLKTKGPEIPSETETVKIEAKDSKKSLTSPQTLLVRQCLLVLAHRLDTSRDRETDIARIKYIESVLDKIIQAPDQDVYRSINKDYAYPQIGVFHQNSSLPMPIDVFFKSLDMAQRVETMRGKGYEDVDFLLFLASGARANGWMKRELQDVYRSLGFTTYEQQITTKKFLKIAESAARKKRAQQTSSLFHVGQRVEYMSRTRGDWHPAVVKSVRSDGSCLVRLGAGAVKIAEPARLRPATSTAAPATNKYSAALAPEGLSENSQDSPGVGGDSDEAKQNCPIGEAIVALLRALGFAEDENTGFWLLLPRHRVRIVASARIELEVLKSSPQKYIDSHSTAQPPDDADDAKGAPGAGADDGDLAPPASPPALTREQSALRGCEDAFRDALRYASGLYGSVSKEWVLGCLQNLYMVHKEAISTLKQQPVESGGGASLGTGQATLGGSQSALDNLRLQLEAKFAQDLASEKKRLYETSMGILQHAEQRGNVAQLPDEKAAIHSGRLIRIKLWPSRSYAPGDPKQYHFRLAESQFFRMMGAEASKYTVQQVEYIVNPPLIKAYNSYRNKLISQGTVSNPPDERLAFHGTSQDVMELIITGGFKIGGQEVKVASGTAYGQGVYTSEEPAFAQRYIKTTGLTSLLLVKVLLTPDTRKVFGSDQQTLQQIISPNKYQVLPSYLVHFTKR